MVGGFIWFNIGTGGWGGYYENFMKGGELLDKLRNY
jgi:hypothetical protein